MCNLSLVEAWALREGGRMAEGLASARRGLEAGEQAGFEPLRALNGTIAGRCLRELGDLEGAIALHAEMMALAEDMDGVLPQCVAEELACDHAAAGEWEEAAIWATRSVAAWGEMRMFAFISLGTVAEAVLRSGARFTLPDLPAGKRYELVRLRTEAILAAHARQPDHALANLAEALRLAEAPELPVEVSETKGALARLSAR